MAKFTSGRQRDLKIGISSLSENQTSIEVIGRVGIGTTVASSALSVVGNASISGVVTASLFDGKVSAKAITEQTAAASATADDLLLVYDNDTSELKKVTIEQAALQGIQGTQGLQGLQGTQGLQGLQGTQGTQGTQGVEGAQGTQGTQGTQGLQGLQGTQGTQGTQGLEGLQGTQGTQGLQGLQGTQGTQ